MYEIDASETVQEESSALEERVHDLLQAHAEVIRTGRGLMVQAIWNRHNTEGEEYKDFQYTHLATLRY